jgi:hypothetical protein
VIDERDEIGSETNTDNHTGTVLGMLQSCADAKSCLIHVFLFMGLSYFKKCIDVFSFRLTGKKKG